MKLDVMKFFIEIIGVVLFFYIVTGVICFLEKKGYLKAGTLARGLGTDPDTQKVAIKKAFVLSVTVAVVVVALMIIIFRKSA